MKDLRNKFKQRLKLLLCKEEYFDYFQNEEKEKRAQELALANTELAFQNREKEKRADELALANTELAFQNEEKEKRAEELALANTELAFQNKEKEKRADELALANTELVFQNKEKEKRADELALAKTELAFQNREKEKRADELILANKELAFQKKLEGYRSEMESVALELTLLIDTANAPIFGIDNKGLVNEWNQTSEKITGFTKDEVLGNDLVQTYITEDYRESVKKVLKNALKGKETANYEFPLFAKSGERVMVLLNSSTRRNAAGEITGVLGVGQDITEIDTLRTESEAIAKELRQFIETANAPIFGIDAKGKVNEWNQSSEKITGFKKAEVLGKDLVETYITEDYREAVKQVLDNALKGKETANYEFPLFTKDGRRVTILLSSSTRRSASGEITGVLGVGQDITEVKKTEQKEQERQKISNQFSSSLVAMSNVSIKSHDNWESIITQELTSIYEFYKLDRMSIWLPDLNGFRMLTYQGEKPNPEGLDFISFTDYPIYFENSKKSHLIISNEVENDARLIELNEYFNITKTRSLLDASAMIDNKLIAIICFESCTPRNWTPEETYFIRSFSENITTLFLRFEDRNLTLKNKLIAKELRQFIETANAPIFGIDNIGLVNEWNQASETITGFKKVDVLGKDLVQTFITEDFREAVKQVLDDALKGKETANFEFPLFTKDGDQVMLFLNSSTRRNTAGEITGVLGVGQDITELVGYRNDLELMVDQRTLKLKQASQYARSLIEASLDPLVTINAEGKITDVNEGSIEVTGVARKKLIGTDFSNYFTEPDLARAGYQEAFEKGSILNYPLTIRHKKGKLTDVLYNASVYRDIDGNILGVFAAARDITQLVSSRKKLELRTTELYEALKKEKDLNELKSRFVSTASHEFRTPLSAINFAAGSMKKYWSKMEPIMIEKKLDKIEKQVLHMTNLLDDVLLVGQAEAGEMRNHPLTLNLGNFIGEIIEEVYHSSQKAQKIVLIDAKKLKNTDIFIDEKLGRNIFVNIISNAVKFSLDAHQVTVELSSEKDHTIISVTDFGIGIPESELNSIFMPFMRGKNVDLIQGTGLGLSIVKDAVSLIGGKIVINSKVGEGTTFVVKIPKI